MPKIMIVMELEEAELIGKMVPNTAVLTIEAMKAAVAFLEQVAQANAAEGLGLTEEEEEPWTR